MALDEENIYAPKRGVNGDFAANPRVMAHDAVDIGKDVGRDVQIPGTGNPGRGAALYCGVDFDAIVVVLEGQTKRDKSGNFVRTTTLSGIKAGSFLPLLVIQVQGWVIGGVFNPSLSEGNLVALL